MSTETTTLAKNETFGLDNLKLDTSSSSSSTEEKFEIEHFYDLCRRAESSDEPNKYLLDRADAQLDVNLLLKNGDTLLCLACNKGFQSLVQNLVENHGADVNLCRSINNASIPSSYSSFTPTITISARRQSRLVNTNSTKKANASMRGDSPLAV
jgi:hypothetical protein